MGVLGLQSYLEQSCPSAIPTISITELVEARSKLLEKDFIIVVDAIAFIFNLYLNSNLEWIGGAQFKQFAEITGVFIQAFSEIGIRLVFFFDGPTVQKKRKTWARRRLETLTKKICNVLDKVSNGVPSTDISRKKYFTSPGGMGQQSHLILEFLYACEVHQSILECDEEIAEYAKRNKVLGVLAHDSDFVIMDIGSALYLDLVHLNINTMETRVYLPGVLAQHLELERSQLPILATLMGTDFIQYDDLMNYHEKLIGARNVNILVPKLAEMIKNLSGVVSEIELFLWIANNVLGDAARVKEIMDSVNSFNTIITDTTEASHAISPPVEECEAMWSWLLEESRLRHMENRQPGIIYAIMRGGAFGSGNSFGDHRLDDLPTFALMTQAIRKRLYGILLQQKPQGESPPVVEEWIMAGPDSLNGPTYSSPEFSSPPHPGLALLWSQDKSLDNARWALFVRSVSPDLDVDSVRSLPSRLIIPVMIVYTALQSRQGLELSEVDAVLATAAVLPHYTVRQLASLPSSPITSRSIRVSSLIMKSTSVFYNLQAACGYPISAVDTAPCTFFDGKLFQLKYRESQRRVSQDILCDNMAESLGDFIQAKKVIFSNQCKVSILLASIKEVI